MRTPSARSEPCAPSSLPARWGTASTSPRPAPGPPGRRVACANACSRCQRSTRGRTRSGRPSRCWDPTLRAHLGKHKPTKMAKVLQTREKSIYTVNGFASLELWSLDKEMIETICGISRVFTVECHCVTNPFAQIDSISCLSLKTMYVLAETLLLYGFWLQH